MLIQHPNLWKTNSLLLKMAIEIVSFPMNNGDFPISFVNVYQRVDDMQTTQIQSIIPNLGQAETSPEW
jgi:hypothetical protein